MTTALTENPLPDVAAIVATDDPQIRELASRLLTMDDDSLCTLNGEARAFIAAQRRDLEERIKHDTLVNMLAEKILLKRIVDSGGRAIAHDRFRVEITAPKTIDKRIDVLRQLDGKVPDDELAPAIYLKVVEPQWEAHAGKLRSLQRKYGAESEIGRIIEAGLIDSYGAPRLVFEQRDEQKRVGPELSS